MAQFFARKLGIYLKDCRDNHQTCQAEPEAQTRQSSHESGTRQGAGGGAAGCSEAPVAERYSVLARSE